MMTRHHYRRSDANFTVILRKFRGRAVSVLTLFCLTVSPTLLNGQETKREGATLLKCLGQEELLLHKKKLEGAIYRLNQTLVNEVASWDKIHLKKRHIKNVCSAKKFSPSVTLLKIFLLHGEDSFNFEKQKFEFENLKEYQNQVIKDFLDRIPKIFFSYLGDLQIMMGEPKCLQKRIPQIDYFFERYRYLEGNINTDQLIQTQKARDKLRAIFQKLEKFDTLVKKCQKK